MKAFLFIFFVVFSKAAWPALLHPGYEFARATGMGNAFIALADDATAIFYNPAALARNQQLHFHLLDTQLLVDNPDTLKRIYNAVFNGETNKLINPDQQSLGLSFKPTLITPYFGVSVFNYGFGFFELNSLEEETAQAFGFNDLGVALGFGIPFSDYFSFGFGVKAIQRSSVELNKSVSEIIAELGLDPVAVFNDPWKALKNYVGVGYAFPLSAGFLISLPPATPSSPLIRLAGTIENIGGTTFNKISGASPPSTLITSFNLGSLLQYSLGNHFTLNLTADLRDTFQGHDFFKTFHSGAELRHRFFGVRTGLSEGYLAYGLSLEFPPHTKLHFSSYAKELGEKLWEKSQRFYQVQLIIGFNPL